MDSCRGCGAPNEGDCLDPEGLCFKCSLGGPQEGCPTSNNVRESFDRIVRKIADLFDDMSAAVLRDRMYRGAKRNRGDS